MRWLGLWVAMLVLAGCNLAVPQVTPTVAPTLTPTVTPDIPATATTLPTQTPSMTPEMVATASASPSQVPTEVVMVVTPTATATVTETRTPEPTATPTLTLTPSITPTGTLPPSDTPTATFTPSLTPTATATETPLPTHTPTWTPLPTDTPTETLTQTPSLTPTGTPLPTDTPTLTSTPSLTPTATPTETTSPTPTDTETPTPIPTVTPLPFVATDTPTATVTPSFTPDASNTPDVVATPTLLQLRVLTATPLNSATQTVATATPTATASPIESVVLPSPLPLVPVTPPTPEPVTPTLAPTIDATPTLITGEIPLTLEPFQATALPGTASPEAVTSPQPTSTQPIPTLLPVGDPLVVVTIRAPNERLFIIPETIAYTLSSGLGVIGVGRFTLENFTTELLAQNPADPNQFVIVNDIGQMHFISDYARDMIVQVTIPMFTQFTYQVTRREENNAAVSAVQWSPEGSLAFIVDGDRENFDGVWLWTPPQSYRQLLRDCPPQHGCETVVDSSGLGQWESLALDWSPDSNLLLVTLNLPDQGRNALVVIDRRAADPERVPGPVLYFESGRWSADGRRIIVAGRVFDGRVVLGSVLPDGSSPDLTDMGAFGYTWTQDAIEVGGQTIGLGSRNGRDSAQSIINRAGEEIVGPIGDGPPQRVDWSADGRAALVVTGAGDTRRYWIASLDQRTVQEISEYVANGVALTWVSGTPPQPLPTPIPPTVAPEPPAEAPEPQPAGGTFRLGDQVRPLGQLNVRAEPTTTTSNVLLVLQGGELLTVLDGPVNAETFEWYQVQTADGTTGWVAGVINGVPSLAQFTP